MMTEVVIVMMEVVMTKAEVAVIMAMMVEVVDVMAMVMMEAPMVEASVVVMGGNGILNSSNIFHILYNLLVHMISHCVERR